MTDEPDDDAIESPAFGRTRSAAEGGAEIDDSNDEWYGDADPRVPDASAWNDGKRDLGFLEYGADASHGEDRATGSLPSDYRMGDAELRELERRFEQ